MTASGLIMLAEAESAVGLFGTLVAWSRAARLGRASLLVVPLPGKELRLAI